MIGPRLEKTHAFPLLLELPPGPEASERLRAERGLVARALAEAGAVLARATAARDAVGFEALWRAFDDRPRAYVEGQSQRERVKGDVYTSTSYPAAENVTLHHELSYIASPPRFLGFFCELAPTSGGATPYADGRELLRALSPSTRAAFEGRGIRYLKTMHGDSGGRMRFGKSWQAHFETTDRAVVEAHLRQGGASWTWLDDGGLRTEQVRPAVRPHPVTGERVWFNQASLWHISNLGARGAQLRALLGPERLPTHATFEDGSEIPDTWMDEVRAVSAAIAFRADWCVGDFLILDNATMLHGREPYTGDRRVLVAMGDGPVL